MIHSPPRSPAPADPAPAVIHAGAGGWSCWISADIPQGPERLRRVFRHQLVDPAEPPASGLEVRLGEDPVSLRVLRQGAPVPLEERLAGPEWRRLERIADPARSLFADTLFGREPALESVADRTLVLQRARWPLHATLAFVWLMLSERPAATLHCGVCAADGLAYVLVGASGSGKSTLAWALQQQGADCYTDEWACFSLPDYELEPLRRDVCLRPGGIDALGAPAPPSWYESRPGDRKATLTLPEPQSPCPTRRTVFLFMDGFAPRPLLEPMAGTDAVRRLLSGLGFADPSIGARLRIAAGLAERYPCWRLTAGPPAETAALLLARQDWTR